MSAFATMNPAPRPMRPSVMLKVILYAYSRGIIRSREIAQACQENVTFMVLSGDSIPHFTTLAAFVRELKDEIANLFTQVLFLCDAQGLIGREMFAIDGVKLPSNAIQGQERHARRVQAPGRQDRSRGQEDAGAPPRGR